MLKPMPLMISTAPPRYTRVRLLASKAFNALRVAELEPVVRGGWTIARIAALIRGSRRGGHRPPQTPTV